MIYDILEVFKEVYEEKGDRLILDSYSLKDGLYVKIDKDGKCSYFISKTVKKDKNFTDLNGSLNNDMFTWFKEKDYYSSYLNSNKALFDKKIHNINYLSYFFKIENSAYVKEKINEHFLILKDFTKFKDKREKELLKKYEYIIKDEYRINDISKKSELLKEKFDEIIETAKEKEIKNYIKIFFDEDIQKYKEESEIYLSLKIFNDNKYNQKLEEKVFGLSNSNMGLNSKKPFLENKTRKLSVPFMIKNENALLLRKFFDWLKLQPYNQNRTLDEEHFFIQKGISNDEAEIKDFDYIPLKSDDVNKNFKPIYVKNYLLTKDKEGNLIKDYEIKELWQLEDKIDELFYNKQLKNNYFRDEIKISNYLSKELQSILFSTKYSMLNYFKKYDKSSFFSTIKKYGTLLIIEQLRNERLIKVKEALNLKFALQSNYEKRNEMNINEKLEEIKSIINSKEEYLSLSRENFLFLSGQWAYYMLSKSRSSNRSFSFAEHYFRANHISRLQKVLNFDLEKYKHAISREYLPIKRTIALLKSFKDENEKITLMDKDIFLIGFTVDNLFYESKKSEKIEEK